MSSRTLITGFGPFGHVTANPSETLARESGRPFQILDVSYRATDQFLATLDPDSFDRILMMGVAASRDHFSLELFARNWKSAEKDVEGVSSEGAIDEGAVLLLNSTLWTAESAAEIVTTESQIRLSMDAGEYLCNYAYYRALQKLTNKQVGFLHVPAEVIVALDQQKVVLGKVLEMIEA